MGTLRPVVLKFGSSILQSEADLPTVVREVRRQVQKGHVVVAVVSAIGAGTDALLAQARRLDSTPCRESAVFPEAGGDAALAALLSTGETTAAALLGLALRNAGVPTTVLDVGRVGPFTRGPQLDAVPYALDTQAVRRALGETPVAVLPGSVGRDEDGNFSLLGRGGSDLTALFASHCLDARSCRLLKDVDGIFENDPRAVGPRPRRFLTLNWRDALDLGNRALQPKAIQFAYRHKVSFEVGSCGSVRPTTVGAEATVLGVRFQDNRKPARGGSVSGAARFFAAATSEGSVVTCH